MPHLSKVFLTSERFRFALFAIGLFIAAAITAACGDGSDEPSATQADILDLSVPTIADTRFEGGDLEPKERTGRNELFPASTVGRVEGADLGTFSRITFFFFDLIPNFRAEYVEAPIACGSGDRLDIEGEVFLQLSTQPAAAHDNQGEPTYELATDLQEKLPAVLEVQQSCDFEGELIWVLGLPEQLDFRTAFTSIPLRYESVVIDIKNPE